MSREKILAIEAAMNGQFIHRKDEIHGLVLGAISKEHVLILGPPGTVKSGMESKFSQYLGSSLNFPWLMTQFTTPDEVFGPVDIQAMKEGTYKRITSAKLPEAETAFIDEVFKANSAILNAMLSILQERIYHNNGQPIKVPLHFAVAASNELPEEDENLQALYDRFLLRFVTGYLDNEDDVSRLLALDNDAPPVVEPMGMDALRVCTSEALALALSDEARDGILLLWSKLREAGLMFSDRRLKLMTKVMAAESWLQGESEIVPDSLIVAENIMWDRPDQIRDVKSTVRSCINPGAAKAQEIMDASMEAMTELGYKGDSKWDLFIHPTQPDMLKVIRQLKMFAGELIDLPQKPGVMLAQTYVQTALDSLLLDRLTNDSLGA